MDEEHFAINLEADHSGAVIGFLLAGLSGFVMGALFVALLWWVW